MSSNFKKELQKVEQYFIYGNFQEALRIIDESLKKKNIKKEDELRFLVQKCEIDFYLGNYQETLQLSELVLKESKKLENISLHIAALFCKALALYSYGKFTEGLNISETGLEILSKKMNLPPKMLAKRKAQFMYVRAMLTSQLGNPEKAYEIVKEYLPFALKNDYKNLAVLNYILAGFITITLGEIEKSEEYHKKALDLATKLENKFQISFCYIILAGIKRVRREYDQALDLFSKAFALAKEIGSTFILQYVGNMGLVYKIMYQLDKALECYKEALNYQEFAKHIANAAIGEIYYWKNDFDQAQIYYLESLKLCEERTDRRILPVVLYNLILISIELKNLAQAKKYLKRLEEISLDTGFDRIDRLYRFASILILKASRKMGDLVQAAEILEKFLDEEKLPFEWRLNIFYSLLEIRLKELQLSPDEEALREVQKRLHHLEVEAEEQQLLWFLANVYRLQSQLTLVELDVSKANGFLDKAQAIAEEIDVELLKKEVRNDRERIDRQLSMLQKFQEQKTPISETVKLVSLESTVKNIKQETVLEERDKETGKIIEYRKLFSLKI